MFFWAVFLIVLVPLFAEAQSFLPFQPITRFGSFSELSSRLAGASLMVGYSTDRRGVTFGLNAEGAGNLGIFGFARYLGNTRSYPVRGVWLGGNLPVSLSEALSVDLSGAYFLPTNREILEVQDWQIAGFLPVQPHQEWTTNIKWWNLSGEGIYQLSGNFAFVGGFRFDSFRSAFNGEAPPSIIPGAGLPGDRSDLDVFTYLPYLGATVSQDWGSGQLKTRLIGFPYVPGTVKFSTTRNTTLFIFDIFDRFEASGAFRSGYFIEVSAEYGVRFGGLLASLFTQYDLLHGLARVELDRTQELFLGGKSTEAAYSLSFDRRVWTVGGKFELVFASPL